MNNILDFKKLEVFYPEEGRRKLGITDQTGSGITQEQLDTAINEVITMINNGTLNALPSGSIVIWPLPLSQIPSGWKFCDGTNGTPDLRGKLLIGTESGVDPGSLVQI